MAVARIAVRTGWIVLALALAACGGGSALQPSPPAAAIVAPVSSASQGVTVALSAAPATVSVPLADGYSASMTVRSPSAAAGTTLNVTAPETTDARTPLSSRPCPSIGPIPLLNPFPFPIALDIDGFTFVAPCDVSGKLFGISFYQTKPRPAIVRSVKVGDATGTGRRVTFSPAVATITLPPLTTSVLVISAESSTSEVIVPVAPGSTTVLTANATNLPTDLSFAYTGASGGATYATACFNAFANGVLDPSLATSPLVGRPSFFCHLDPGNAAITFSTAVKFVIGAPKPDASVLGLDGPTATFTCGPASTSTTCNTQPFTIGSAATAYKNVVVGNVDDIRACAPVTENTDCNKLASPAPARTNVSGSAEFQVLVADDPTYRAGAGPWDGIFRKAIAGPCAFSTGADNGNNDVPPSPIPGSPGYSDSNQDGIGPYAELEIKPTGAGTCTITFSEDPKFIVADFSNPAMPKGRSVQLTLTLH